MSSPLGLQVCSLLALKLLDTSIRFKCSSKNSTKLSFLSLIQSLTNNIFSLLLFCLHSKIRMFIKSRLGSSEMIQNFWLFCLQYAWCPFIELRLESVARRHVNSRDLILGNKAWYPYFQRIKNKAHAWFNLNWAWLNIAVVIFYSM